MDTVHIERLINQGQDLLLKDRKGNREAIGVIVCTLDPLLPHGKKLEVQQRFFPNHRNPRDCWRKYLKIGRKAYKGQSVITPSADVVASPLEVALPPHLEARYKAILARMNETPRMKAYERLAQETGLSPKRLAALVSQVRAAEEKESGSGRALLIDGRGSACRGATSLPEDHSRLFKIMRCYPYAKPTQTLRFEQGDDGKPVVIDAATGEILPPIAATGRLYNMGLRAAMREFQEFFPAARPFSDKVFRTLDRRIPQALKMTRKQRRVNYGASGTWDPETLGYWSMDFSIGDFLVWDRKKGEKPYALT